MGKTVGVILALTDKCSPQLNKIADKLGMTEKEFKKANKQIQNLQKSIGGGLKKATTMCVAGFTAVAGASAVLVNKSMEAGDRIDKMSQKMQMSRKTFQEMEYVFSQNGADISMMQTGMSKLSKAMEGARSGAKGNVKTFQQLGISLKDNQGHFKSTENVMFEALAKLQKMPESAHKTALSLQLFGKSATELQPLLNGNAKGVEELRKKFHDLGMGMSDEQVDASVKFKDTLDTIQRAFMGLGNQLGADLIPTIQLVADKIVNNMPKIKATVEPILKGMLNTIKFLIDHMEGLSAIAITVVSTFALFKTITSVITIIKTLQTAIQAVSAVQGIWNALMLANPIGLVAVSVGALIGVLVYLQMKFQIFTKTLELFKKVASGIKNVFDKGSNKDNKPNVPKYASGTSFAQGGLSLVGERGPELLNLPQGAKVTPTNETKKMLSNNINLNLTIQGNVIGNTEFAQQISNILGQRLQVAMGC